MVQGTEALHLKKVSNTFIYSGLYPNIVGNRHPEKFKLDLLLK